MAAIEVVDYDPQWPLVFQQLSQRAWSVLEDVADAIEHVGSTSVPGLAAKPVIDMSVVVCDQSCVELAIARLESIGYQHRGDLGIEGREAFFAPRDLPAHHLYVCPHGSLGLRNHLAVREYLRQHADVAHSYAELKKSLAAGTEEIAAYGDGKTALLIEILRRAALSEGDLRRIEAANRQK